MGAMRPQTTEVQQPRQKRHTHQSATVISLHLVSSRHQPCITSRYRVMQRQSYPQYRDGRLESRRWKTTFAAPLLHDATLPAMSTPAAKKRAPQKPRVGKNGSASYKIAGIELPCDPDLEFDKPTPTPLFPVSLPCVTPIILIPTSLPEVNGTVSAICTDLILAVPPFQAKAPDQRRENPSRSLPLPTQQHSRRTIVHSPRRQRTCW